MFCYKRETAYSFLVNCSRKLSDTWGFPLRLVKNYLPWKGSEWDGKGSNSVLWMKLVRILGLLSWPHYLAKWTDPEEEWSLVFTQIAQYSRYKYLSVLIDIFTGWQKLSVPHQEIQRRVKNVTQENSNVSRFDFPRSLHSAMIFLSHSMSPKI